MPLTNPETKGVHSTPLAVELGSLGKAVEEYSKLFSFDG